jgi:hypothetical protein
MLGLSDEQSRSTSAIASGKVLDRVLRGVRLTKQFALALWIDSGPGGFSKKPFSFFTQRVSVSLFS